MKDNKINVDLLVPSIGKKYNLFIPSNKLIGEIIYILSKTIHELTGYFPENHHLVLYDVIENKIYENNIEVINTEIKNGSVLALI